MIYLKKIILSLMMITIPSVHLHAGAMSCSTNIAGEYVVKNSSDNGDDSLRVCIKKALVTNANIVVFDNNYNILLATELSTGANDNNITIDGGTNTIVIDGNHSVKILNTDGNTATITLNNLTLQNAFNNLGQFGGAIYLDGDLVIDSCLFKDNNTSNYGATIFANTNANILIKNSNFSKNSARLMGGVISSQNDVTINIQNSIFSQNKALDGGIIFAFGRTAISIKNSTLTQNNAGNGGVVSTQTKSTIDIQNSTLSMNEVTSSGGAIYAKYANISIQNSTIAKNRANDASGIHLYESNATIINSTISNNIATNAVGAIAMLRSGILSISSSTITKNSAGDRFGAIYADSGATVIIHNTILTGNTGPRDNDANEVTSLGWNIVGDIGIFNAYDAFTDMNGTDPKLGALADNGGDTETHALLAGSPAINAGNTALTTDQRSLPRTGLADIGAYEAQSSGVINAPAFIDDYIDNKAKGAANELPVASTPLSSSAKALMALLFAGVAFFGFRRKRN